MNNVLKRALISEKSFGKVAGSKFTFIVEKHATKEEIAENVKTLFGVDVVDVNTASYSGKIKRGRKGEGKRSDYKKAVVSLKAGQRIDLFEIEAPKEEKEEKKEKKSSKKTEEVTA